MIRNTHNLSIFLLMLMMSVSVGAWANDGYTGGYHPTGIDGTTVYLNDLEDHTWTLYQGLNSQYSYPDSLLFSDPRDVTIEYDGLGTFADDGTAVPTGYVKVSMASDENQNKFVYYETLKKTKYSSTNIFYQYNVIPNPFAVRPSRTIGGVKTYYGNRRWKVVKIENGTIKTASGTAINENDFIDGDSDVRLYPTSEYGMKIQFAAYWEVADRVMFDDNWTSGTSVYTTMLKGHRELNFLVVNRSTSTTITNTVPVTVMMQEPDGSASYKTTTGNKITHITIGNSPIKVEHSIVEFPKNATAENFPIAAASNSSALFDANACLEIGLGTHDVIIGRGIEASSAGGLCIQNIRGINAYSKSITDHLKYRLRVESGVYRRFEFIRGNMGEQDYPYLSFGNYRINFNTVIGCDFDRASASKKYVNLKIKSDMQLGADVSYNRSSDNIANLFFKSGDIMCDRPIGDAHGYWGQTCYFSISGGGNSYITRNITVYDARFTNMNMGPYNTGINANNIPGTIWIKGGLIRGSIYMGASTSPTGGSRRIVLTGGTVQGWVGGGCNGQSDGGQMEGRSFIYVGGNVQINSNGSTSQINNSLGGNVYGAGCGVPTVTTAGEMTLGTNVVVADDAFVERNVYGGGNYGYSLATARIIVQNGTIGGSVFGGANQNKTAGLNSEIIVLGGNIKKGVYGGCNVSGTMSGNTTIKVLGGIVGESVTPTNVCGGGYGSSTYVTGNVSVSIGSEPSGTDKTANKGNISDLTIYGDVYGGSALGKTNSGSSKTTSVKMYSGTVNGDVYGGALGSTSAAATIGATSQTVDIYGGKVTGAVYGGSNINASLTASTKPQLGVTIHDTYTPAVAGEYAIGNVFGGGNGATAAASGQPGAHDTNTNGTFVTVDKGSIGNVFGGGNAATAMKTTVNVADGTIGNIYGGSNQANINGTTSITVSGGTVSSGIYGGCNALGNVTGVTNVSITGGTVGTEASLANIHGGGYGQSTTTGNDVNVTIGALTDGKGSTTGPTIYADIYGGSALGSVCSSTASPVNTSTVNIYSGNILKGNVYGGGLGSKNGVNGATADVAAVVNGNTQVNVYAAHFGSDSEVFGGNNLNGSPTGSTTVHVYETETPTHVVTNQTSFPGEADDNPWTQYAIKSVYGGSNKAMFHDATTIGQTNVIVDDCNSSIAYVYGGSNAADVYGSTNVTINGADKIGVVFGGGNGKGEGNPGANVLKNSDSTDGGNTTTTINGGTVDFVFGGSNTLGDVKGKATVNLEDNSGACTYLLGEVYGAGNAADMHGTPELNIGCITGLGTIYGGARNANLYSDVNLNITGGTYEKIFGGNNIGGTLDGSITVNIEETGCQPINIDNLYAGGNQAAYSTPSGKSDPIINIKSATSIGNVYGGGLGSTAIVTGNPTVNINMEPGVLNKGTASESVQPLGTIGNVFGGGDAAETKGNTTINLATESGKSAPITGNVYGGGNQAAVDGNTTINATGGTAANIFGGGNGYIDADNSANNKAADVTGNTTVNLTGTQISTALYGGCNALGTVGGDAKLDMTGGSIGSVYGGGYGEPTVVSGNVDVNVGSIDASKVVSGTAAVTGDVYGGSALGTVGTNGVTTNHVNVVLNSGSVGGSLYGGGLGRKADDTATPAITAVEAKVYSPVQVTMNGGTIAGDIFGCNNLNGAPQSTVQVDINKTAALQTSPLKYAVNAVYGGGNLADAAITPTVNINDCSVNIGSVYGGGNAAATSGTNATIWGGTIGNAFGGGNGESGVAANVNGNSLLNIYGGTVTNAFAGSNMHGTISGTMALNVGGATETGPCDCDLNVANTYGGGNQAEGKGATITIGCGSGYLGNVYGGAKAAKINGDLVLNIEGGEIDNVFGGNDQSGEITGDITVNIKTGGCNDAKIKNVYGGGNMAPFNHNTTVNLINGKVGYMKDGVLQGGNVFGGGYGSTAVVTGNTTVNLCSDDTHTFEVLDGIYGGGELANVAGNPTINLTKGKAQNVYGGGKQADINGSTTVNMDGTAEISTGIYGGCNVQGTVTGATAVNLNGGTLGTSTTPAKGVFGGGYGEQTLVNGNVVVEEKGTTVYGDIYGGSALGNVNGTIAEGATEPTATTDATTHVTLTSGSVTGNIYGGGLGQQHADAHDAVAEVPAIAAKVFGPVTVALNGGSLTGNAFGCNYLYGAPQSTVNVELNSTQDAAVVTGNMYGGGNVAAYSGNPSVAVQAGTLNGSVFGGGLGSTAVVTGDPQVNVTGGTVTGTVYGGGDAADVNGGTTVKVTGAQTKVNGSVFGGGNNASVSGPTNVQVGGK